MTSDKATSLELRLGIMQAGDAWNTLSLGAGWSGSLKYRYEMDRRSVRLKFSRSAPGTAGNGTVIATLPAAYRPNALTELALTVDHMDVSGGSPTYQSPHAVMNTDGTIEAWGCGLAGLVSINQTFAIFDD